MVWFKVRRLVSTLVAVGVVAATVAVVQVVETQGSLQAAGSCAGTATQWTQGDGSADDPFQIETADHLLYLSSTSAQSDWDKHFVQTADIDLNDCTWTPIGTLNDPFTGTYDGDGRVISKLTVGDGTASDQGLFGFALGASLEGIRLVDATVRGVGHLGALVGRAVGLTMIDNSSVTGASSVEGTGGHLGGLVGRLDSWSTVSAGSISRSSSTAQVNGREGQGPNGEEGSQYVGGLIGIARGGGSISESFATGAVAGYKRVGGLIGQTGPVFVRRTYADGAVRGTTHVGGLVGDSDSATEVVDSFATGAVTGTLDSRPHPSFGVEGTWFVGGLVGMVNTSVTIANSYSTGRVEVEAGAVANFGQIGGFVGRMLGAVSASFFDEATTGLTASAGGAGLSTVLMQTLATFVDAGWDISSSGSGRVWVACDGVYPALMWTDAGRAASAVCAPPAPVVTTPPTTSTPPTTAADDCATDDGAAAGADGWCVANVAARCVAGVGGWCAGEC
jgi:hypothetical protein